MRHNRHNKKMTQKNLVKLRSSIQNLVHCEDYESNIFFMQDGKSYSVILDSE